ncbi:MAG: hypothetical protein H6719_25575 [Sandaracinaceae bacterium]|nr:hypothetical protein [Sandaracinaceae bacterium]
MVRSSLIVLVALGLAACSVTGRPSGRTDDGGGGTGADGGMTGSFFDAGDCVPSVEGTPETCSDGLDNNCNGRYDCSDLACSGVGTCPVCGEVETALGSPLALPDGVGNITCTTDADCPGTQHCFTIDGLFGPSMECRESYRSTLSFIGFGSATFDSVSDIRSLCVVMEHSWIRDTEITLEAPNGAQVRLQRFLGQEGGEIYLGQANDCDDDGAPSPGTGARYCWTPTATNQAMLDYANAGGRMDSATTCNGTTADMMPPGDYSASDPWTNLIGAPLNGDWTLSVTDLWPIDNGYIFEWSISFDPVTVEDCSSPLI